MGRVCLRVSYVTKKIAAGEVGGGSALLDADRKEDRIRTTRCTTDDDASHTSIDASEASGFREALG